MRARQELVPHCTSWYALVRNKTLHCSTAGCGTALHKMHLCSTGRSMVGVSPVSTVYTGSFRMNVKRKTVCTGINFHKCFFFGGVLVSDCDNFILWNILNHYNHPWAPIRTIAFKMLPGSVRLLKASWSPNHLSDIDVWMSMSIIYLQIQVTEKYSIAMC